MSEQHGLVCSKCWRAMDAYLNSANELDDSLRLLGDLCTDFPPEHAVPDDTLGRLGSALSEYLDRRDALKQVFLGKPGHTQSAVILGEILKIKVSNPDLFPDYIPEEEDDAETDGGDE